MEALTAVSVAALTVYDMCKALEKGMTITDLPWRVKPRQIRRLPKSLNQEQEQKSGAGCPCHLSCSWFWEPCSSIVR
jgi:hypothetical protein